MNLSENFPRTFKTGAAIGATLRRMKSERAGSPRRTADTEEVPALPVWKAFVVQFSRETGAQSGTFSGRVEHMSSGRRARFASREDLVATLQQMLDQLGENGV